MRTFCVIFGAVIMVFSGVCLIQYQKPIREAGFKQFPKVSRWFSHIASSQDEFSVSSSFSVEPRSLLD